VPSNLKSINVSEESAPSNFREYSTRLHGVNTRITWPSYSLPSERQSHKKRPTILGTARCYRPTSPTTVTETWFLYISLKIVCPGLILSKTSLPKTDAQPRVILLHPRTGNRGIAKTNASSSSIPGILQRRNTFSLPTGRLAAFCSTLAMVLYWFER
jgi:hypothetical protein